MINFETGSGKMDLQGSSRADYRCQVSGFGCQGVEKPDPETSTLTPKTISQSQFL